MSSTNTGDAMVAKDESRAMVREHFADVRAMLGELPDERWDEASFCEGWRVRDLIGHLLAGTTIPIPRFAATLAAGGFRIDEVSRRVSIELGNQPIGDLREQFNKESSREKPRGFAGLLPPQGILLDWVTHYLDIVIPLDINVDIPDDRLTAALDVARKDNRFKTKKRSKGLRLIATDLDWRRGSGPEVYAPAGVLISTLGGRPQLLAELEGDGADLLRQRVAA
ncbi:MAG: maleylpyruvate isomerase family mycothiol-dependent enzyme [Acidimicrobiia bacterium]|nr:maleylpyruvate isomerase family mycothiol-dependent enzyme [Acidimicrobiia bacterium]